MTSVVTYSVWNSVQAEQAHTKAPFFGSIEHAWSKARQGMALLSFILSLSMCVADAEDVGVELHVVVDVLWYPRDTGTSTSSL